MDNSIKVLRSRKYELDSEAGLVFEEVASECFAVVNTLSKYHFLLRDASGVPSKTISDMRDQLTEIFVNAGLLYWEEIPVKEIDEKLLF